MLKCQVCSTEIFRKRKGGNPPRYCADCRKKVIKATSQKSNKKMQKKLKEERAQKGEGLRAENKKGKIFEAKKLSNNLAKEFLKKNKRKRMALSTNSSCFDAGEFYGQ